jgi:hypothetical protein
MESGIKFEIAAVFENILWQCRSTILHGAWILRIENSGAIVASERGAAQNGNPARSMRSICASGQVEKEGQNCFKVDNTIFSGIRSNGFYYSTTFASIRLDPLPSGCW